MMRNVEVFAYIGTNRPRYAAARMMANDDIFAYIEQPFTAENLSKPAIYAYIGQPSTPAKLDKT
jgi:hypothetical protein